MWPGARLSSYTRYSGAIIQKKKLHGRRKNIWKRNSQIFLFLSRLQFPPWVVTFYQACNINSLPCKEVWEVFLLTDFLFHYLAPSFKSRDEISLRGKCCNIPDVIADQRLKLDMTSYAWHNIALVSALTWHAFTKTRFKFHLNVPWLSENSEEKKKKRKIN